MVTSTTKTLNYTIGNGIDKNNSVNATITSTPAFNGRYLGKIPGMLKLFGLILAIVALALVACLRDESFRHGKFREVNGIYNQSGTAVTSTLLGTASVPAVLEFNGTSYIPVSNATSSSASVPMSVHENVERYLPGEVFFLCAHTAALVTLFGFLMSYLFHTVSQMVTPKATTLEVVFFFMLAMLLITAGIVELVMTVQNKTDRYGNPTMFDQEYGMRLAAGIIALINGVLMLIAFFVAKRELDGPVPGKSIQ